MLQVRTRFTRAILMGGLLSLTAAVTNTYAVTAQAQAQAPVPDDATVAAKIHKAITADKALAAYADSIRIIVSSGRVSLKGAVKSDADKKAIGQIADNIAGAPNVMNNLFVSAEKTDTAQAGKPTP
jgi:osmotically-inducible protein OsmY